MATPLLCAFQRSSQSATSVTRPASRVPNTTQGGRLGKKIALGVSLVFIALFSETLLAAAEPKDCHLKRHASLDLAEDPTGLVIPVIIEGSEERMVLEAGDWASYIAERDAHRLSLHVRPLPRGVDVQNVDARNNTVQLQAMAIAKRFAFGNIALSGASFYVVPNKTVAANVIGSVGMNMFANFDIEIDIANRKFNLYSPEHCPSSVVYWSARYDSVPIRVGKLGELYFPMVLNGKAIEATLATDLAVTTLTTDVTRWLFGFDANSADIETSADADGRTTARYRAMQLRAEGLDVLNAKIELVKRPADYCHITSRSGATGYEGCSGVHPLRLGLNVLRKLHVYVATKEKILYFTLAGAAN